MELENQPDNTPDSVTAIILNPQANTVLCVARETRQFLAMWTDIDAALVALSRQQESEWMLIGYDGAEAEQELLFQVVSGSAPGQLDGYVVNPGTDDERKRRVAALPLTA